MDYIKLTPKEQIELLINNKLFETHTCIPAIVAAVNYDSQRLDAKIAVNAIADIDGKEVAIEYPVLHGIPFCSIQGGKFFITVPPKPGDTCMLFFCERNADNFWDTGKASAPTYAQSRKHNINDAIAIVGFNPKTKEIPNFKSDRVQIRDKEGKNYISLTDHSVTLSSGTSVIYLHNDNILIRRRENDAHISIKQESIVISRGSCKITLTNEGILLDTDTTLTISADKVDVVSDGDISFDAANINFKADNNISMTSESVGIEAADNIAVSSKAVNINSAVHITGDLDVNTFKFKPLPFKKRALAEGEGDPTPGYLYTGILDNFTQFVENLNSKNANFRIVVKGDELNIDIPYEKFVSDDPETPPQISDYAQLATAISLLSNELFTCAIEEISTWTDIANLLSESSFGKVEYNVTGRLIFTYRTAGKANMSFMQHTPDTQELQTIDGSSLLMGSEFLAYQKYDMES